MLENINVSVAPHIKEKRTTASIMADVCIALVFPLLAGIYAYGIDALITIVLCIASCVLFEFLFQKLMKQKVTVNDFSALVTGMILAVNLPADVPWFIPVLGSAFAIIIVKQLFGGLGQNFMNPALGARCFLLISFAKYMTTFSTDINYIFEKSDALTAATPLTEAKLGNITGWFDMLVNTHPGSIGEVSAIAVLIGAAYLVIKKVIDFKIPLIYIGSTVLFITFIQLLSGNSDVLTFDYYILQICGGGLLVGAFFMATDYVTSPITPKGKVIYALILGLMTSLIRTVSPSSEGVSYSIIIGNMLTPLIEKYTVSKPFGYKKGAKI